MKIFFVTILLATFLFILIMMLDALVGISFSHLFAKLRKPYQVADASEYFVVIALASIFIIKMLFDYLKKKKGNNPSAN